MQKSSFFRKFNIKSLDSVILLIFAVTVVFSFFGLRKKGGNKPKLIINTPREQYIYEMDKNRTLKIEGAIGISIIVIENGEAYFVDSPCPNKTCVYSMPISENFEWIGCLPNQVFIRIEKEEEDSDTDASTF